MSLPKTLKLSAATWPSRNIYGAANATCTISGLLHLKSELGD